MSTAKRARQPSFDYDNPPIGQRFGWLTLIRNLGQHRVEKGDGRRYWLMKCACGIEKPIRAYDAVSGNCTSCGCRRRIRNLSYAKRGYLMGSHPLTAHHLSKPLFNTASCVSIDEDWEDL